LATRKRLIEHNFPLADISEASARDKNVRLVTPLYLVGAAAAGLLPRHCLCRAEDKRKEKRECLNPLRALQ